MANGEVVFAAPWQSRVFGIAVALCEQGLFGWPEFQAELIKAVQAWDETHVPATAATQDYQYFDHFSAALCATLTAKKLFTTEELDELVLVLQARPHDHDHHHEH